MTFNQFQETPESEEPSETGEPRVFPRLAPVEDGAITFRRRGRVGHIHYLEDENSLAYVRRKTQYFYKYNGYAISADVLDNLSDTVDELREAGTVPEDATLDYVLFFIPEDREILKFTVGQYLDAPHEYTNTNEPGGDDLQYIVPEENAVHRWPDGYNHVMSDPDYPNGYIST